MGERPRAALVSGQEGVYFRFAGRVNILFFIAGRSSIWRLARPRGLSRGCHFSNGPRLNLVFSG